MNPEYGGSRQPKRTLANHGGKLRQLTTMYLFTAHKVRYCTCQWTRATRPTIVAGQLLATPRPWRSAYTRNAMPDVVMILARSKRCCPSPFLDPLNPHSLLCTRYTDMNRVQDRNRLLVPPEPILELCFNQPSPRTHSSLSRLCMRWFSLTVILGGFELAAAQARAKTRIQPLLFALPTSQPQSTKAAL
jgi:hypothetical protein